MKRTLNEVVVGPISIITFYPYEQKSHKLSGELTVFETIPEYTAVIILYSVLL